MLSRWLLPVLCDSSSTSYPFLRIFRSTLFDFDLVFRMSQGTRGHLGRAHARGNEQEEGNLPPSPSMAQVLMEIERNRRDSHALLEVIARNSTQQRNEMLTLNDFIHLRPPVFSYSTEPLDADDCFAASRGNFKQDMLRLVTESTMPLTTSRVQPTLGGRTISTCVPKGRPLHGMSSAPHSVSTTSPRVLWTVNVRSSATTPKVEGLLTSTAVSSTGWPVTQLKRSPPTPRSRKGSVGDFTLGSAVSLTFMTLPPSRSLSTRPSRQRT